MKTLVPVLIVLLLAGETTLHAADTVELRGTDGNRQQWDVDPDEIDTPAGTGRATLRRPAARDVTAWRAEWRQRGGQPVLYRAGAERTPAHRRIGTDGIHVQLAPGTDPATVARGAGLTVGRSFSYAPGHWLLRASNALDALALLPALRATPGVLSAEPLLGRQWERRSVTAPNDTLFGNQWHLVNRSTNGGISGLAGADANVTNAWATVRGTNIVIGIVDDGVQWSHPDLTNRYYAAASYDWNGADADPSPDPASDEHGTSCAGVALASGDNSLGVCGAAWQARLAGLRLISTSGISPTDAIEADAMTWSNGVIHIKSNSWGPGDSGNVLDGGGPLALAALQNATVTGRGGRGVIFCWAGGNGGHVDDNSNYDSWANSPFTLAVGALNDQGQQSYYSEDGANLIVAAPSNDTGHGGIWTTDLTGGNGYNTSGTSPEPSDQNYTSTFGGTSSATPLVAGVCALVLNANTNLGYRDVMEILARSATQTDPADSDWITNAAGFRFNHKYGAGRVNAGAAVTLAATWTNLGPLTQLTTASSNLALAIPDNTPAGVTHTFDLGNANLRVEQVALTANITHAYRGDIDIRLTSPSGITSMLQKRHSDGTADIADWTYSTTHHWGESARGTWTVTVSDRAATDAGTLNALVLRFYGTSLSNTAPAVVSATATEVSPLSNTNTWFDPGETVSETLVLGNVTTSALVNVTATLATTNPAVTLLTSALTNLTLPAAGRRTNTGAFLYRIAKSYTGTNLAFTLVTTAPGLPPLTNTLTRTVGRLVIANRATNVIAVTPARAIPDGGDITTGQLITTNTVALAGTNVLDDIQVQVLATHPETLDLSLAVTHPDGTSVRLARANVMGGANLGSGTNYTAFLDNGGSRLPFGTAPFSNSSGYVAMSELTPLHGRPVNGAWKLTVRDHGTGDTGTLTGWKLRLVTHRESWTNAVFNNPPLATSTNLVFTNTITTALTGTDLDSDPLTFQILTNVVNGSVTGFNTNTGAFTYTATIDEAVTDSLTYRVSDGSTGATAVVTFQVLPTDADLDAMPDAWETQYGLSPADPADATVDTDGDGQPNLAEYLAGTDPTSPSSALRLIDLTVTNTLGVVRFTSVTNRNYRLQSTPDLLQPWTNLGPLLPGTGTNVSVLTTNPAPRAYYRIILTP